MDGHELKVISIAESLQRIHDLYNPVTIGRVNGIAIKLVRIKGEFLWHHHDNEDELFLVLRGRLRMKLRSGDLWVEEGQMLVIPRGVEHCPVAPDEVHLVLVEPEAIQRTGNVTDVPDRLRLED